MRPRPNVPSSCVPIALRLFVQRFRAALVVLAALTVLLPTVTAAWAQTSGGSASAEYAASISSSGQIQAMKLVEPGVGWVLQQSHLYWTQNNGKNWVDITPGSSQQHVGSVFFMDKKNGWAFIEQGGSGGASRTAYTASTQNSGQTWKISAINPDIFPQMQRLAGVTSIFFLDTQHGWLVLRLASSTNFSIGVLLQTEDGGITWSALPPPPAAGSLSFATPKNGWMVGGPAGEGLWGTDDGGNSWQQRNTAAPEIAKDCQKKYGELSFSDRGDGVLTATIVCLSHSYVADYTLHNGGQWKINHLNEEDGASQGGAISAILGSHAIHILSSSQAGVTIHMPEGEASPTLPPGMWPKGSFVHATFVDNNNGWLLYSAGQCAEFKSKCSHQSELLSTVDGGKTLTRITPEILTNSNTGAPQAKQQSDLSSRLQGEGEKNPNLVQGIENNSQSGIQSLYATEIANNEGFDACAAPSISNMQTWFDSSPYFSTSAYMGGVSRSCSQPNLTSSWVSTVTQQGWGIIPLWVGPQATCTQCTTCTHLLSSTPSVAATQGQQEASSAASAASALGMGGSIVYYNMEQYDTGNSVCSSSVQSFVNSWVQELHALGFQAGVYGAPSNASADWTGLVNIPDAIWFSSWDNVDSVLDPSRISNGLWPNNQRIHQFCSVGNSYAPCTKYGNSFGGVTISIDGDVLDGPVFSGSAPAQAPTVTTASASSITTNSATLGGTVNPNGLDTHFWFLYGTNSTLTGASQTTSPDLGSGTTVSSISGNISSLSAGTTYYYEAVAQNSAGTNYGNIFNFTTTASTQAPTVSTGGSASVTSNSASVGGTVNPNGSSTIGWFEFGTDSGLSLPTSTPQQSLGSGTSNVAFNAPLSGLSGNTIYYFRAVANNSGGTIRGSISNFTTPSGSASAPTVTTGSASVITTNSVTLNGSVNPNGLDTHSWFLYGTNSNLSGATQTPPAPSFDEGSGTTVVGMSVSPTGLSAGTTYYYRVVAQNSAGTTNGNILSFTTTAAAQAPFATTGLANSVTTNSATLTGSVGPNGADTHFWFLYATNLSLSGATQTPSQDLGSGTTISSINANIAGLSAGTQYFYQVVAQNSSGTTYGAVVSFGTTTAVQNPIATTGSASSITANSATLSATVNPNGADTHAQFLYGTSSSLSGATQTTLQDLGSGTTSTPLSANITGLSPGTLYYYKVTAGNSAGTGNGNILSFTTTTAANPTVTSLTANPSTVIGGSSTWPLFTVQLSGPAPSGGASITLTSSNPSLLTVGPVPVGAGNTSGSATYATNSVSTTTTVTVTATYNGSSQQTTVTVTPAAAATTTTSVSVSPSSIALGSSSMTQNLTATVTTTSGTPTGTVAFKIGSVTVGSVPLSGGRASLSGVAATTANGFAVGGDTVTASYTPTAGSGFIASSGTQTLTVTAPAYTITPTSASVSLNKGGAQADTVTLASTSFADTTAWTATASSPSIAVSPSSGTATLSANGSSTVSLTITASSSAANHAPRLPWTNGLIAFGAVLVGVPLARRRKRVMAVLLTALAISTLGFLMSCGGGGGSSSTPPASPRSYTVTISGTGGTSSTIAVTVQ